MSKHLEIRRAQVEDEPAVRKCAEDAYEQYVAEIGKKPAPMVADFASLIASEHVYVAVDLADDILGFIVFFQKGDQMLLENVAVCQNAIRKGIGKRLIAYCEATAKHANLASVHLYTNEKMTANLSLYPHLGYQETERKEEDGFNRIFFEKTI